MGTNSDWCFQHMQPFEGSQCPRCAVEAREREESARMSGAAGGPAGGPTPSSSGNGPDGAMALSPSDAKQLTERAARLLTSATAREALDLCEQAIGADPTDIQAHLVGARACRLLHDTDRERELCAAAIGLLRRPEYATTSSWYHEALRHAGGWQLTGRLTDAFMAARTWPTSEVLAFARALMAADASSDALVLLDGLEPRERSLGTCACMMQVSCRRASAADPDLQAYLLTVPAGERDRLLAEFDELKTSGTLAGGALEEVRAAVRSRYEGWSNDIGRQIRTKAKAEALQAIGSSWLGAAVSSAAWCLVGSTVLAVVLAVICAGSKVVFVLALMLAPAGGALGFVYGRNTGVGRRLATEVPRIGRGLADVELSRWAEILDTTPHQYQPPSNGPSAAPAGIGGGHAPTGGAGVAADTTACDLPPTGAAEPAVAPCP